MALGRRLHTETPRSYQNPSTYDHRSPIIYQHRSRLHTTIEVLLHMTVGRINLSE